MEAVQHAANSEVAALTSFFLLWLSVAQKESVDN